METPTQLPDLTGVATTAQVMAHDLSLWGLFMSADFIVKIVMIGLLAASFWSWTIIFNKAMRLKSLFSAANHFEDSFWSGGSLDALYERVGKKVGDPMSAVFSAAMREWKRSTGSTRPSSVTVQERIERAMQVVSNREMDKLERHMGFLASLGSTATFVGLFGTVWGIMNSFQSIAAAQNTSLAVVAPGIAEALFATAIGLVAAIPAVIAYQKFALELNRYANRLDSFSSEFGAIISRQLEEGR
ncbi:MAG: protein TolQ [Alphaproteobacteria bacterium]|nr:protein TolQ [Alphaproteobacteria bacterium]